MRQSVPLQWIERSSFHPSSLQKVELVHLCVWVAHMVVLVALSTCSEKVGSSLIYSVRNYV